MRGKEGRRERKGGKKGEERREEGKGRGDNHGTITVQHIICTLTYLKQNGFPAVSSLSADVASSSLIILSG